MKISLVNGRLLLLLRQSYTYCECISSQGWKYCKYIMNWSKKKVHVVYFELCRRPCSRRLNILWGHVLSVLQCMNDTIVAFVEARTRTGGYFERAVSGGFTVEVSSTSPSGGLTDGCAVRLGLWVNIICISNQCLSRRACTRLLRSTSEASWHSLHVRY